MAGVAPVANPGRALPALTDANKLRFLEAFSECGVIHHACVATGIGVSTVWDWRDSDPAFNERMRVAGTKSIDVLETELFRRGVMGWDEPVYQGGELVGTVRKHSDACLIFALKGNAPAKYRERYDITSGGEPIVKVYAGFELDQASGQITVPSKVIDQPQLPAPVPTVRKRLRRPGTYRRRSR